MAKPRLDRYGYHVLFGTFAGPAIQVFIFSAILWRLDLIHAWLYLAVGLLGMGPGMTILSIVNPELVNQRGRWKKVSGTKKWDKYLIMAFVLSGFYMPPVIAAIDIKYAILPPACMIATAAGSLAFLFGSAILYWAMLSNRHFEATVRIQTDRDHKVVDTGPYRIVRHPGYVGVILWVLPTSLILGSYLGLIPGIIAAATMAFRTYLEDKTLHRELPGYPEFAGKTRYRLIPGIW